MRPLAEVGEEGGAMGVAVKIEAEEMSAGA